LLRLRPLRWDLPYTTGNLPDLKDDVDMLSEPEAEDTRPDEPYDPSTWLLIQSWEDSDCPPTQVAAFKSEQLARCALRLALENCPIFQYCIDEFGVRDMYDATWKAGKARETCEEKYNDMNALLRGEHGAWEKFDSSRFEFVEEKWNADGTGKVVVEDPMRKWDRGSQSMGTKTLEVVKVRVSEALRRMPEMWDWEKDT
jgi:hypothetical protein